FPAAILSLGQAAELPQTTETTTANTVGGKPQVQGQTELPVHIQNLITSHINQVLQHVKNKNSNTLTGAIGGSTSAGSWSGSGSGSSSAASWSQSGSINGAPVVKPYPDLLPPLAHPGDVPPLAIVDRPASASAVQSGLQPVQAGHPQVRTVTNHQAIGTLIHQGRPVVQNKVVMPPVGLVVHPWLGNQEPIDVAEKLQKLQQHVAKVMQQAEKHIPLALQQAIQKKKEQQAQREKEELQKDKDNNKDKEVVGEQNEQQDIEHNPGKTGRALVIPPKVSNIVNQVHAHIPQLLAHHREEIKLGKCNFECPRQALNICASNGKCCVVNFPGQCELSQWNCFNTKNVFHQVHDSECQNTITCYQKDMM
ncbi:hypothetical protein KR059_001553, partial [Drosophila kikkawai]